LACARIVLARDVRAKLLVAVGNGVQDQRALFFLLVHPVFLRTEEKSQLQRHIEPWKPGLRVDLDARDVVNAVPALADDPLDLADPLLPAVLGLQRTPRQKAAVGHREHRRAEQLPVASIDRAVDEDTHVVGCRHHTLLFEREDGSLSLLGFGAEDTVAGRPASAGRLAR
jgi:hypothetical protein